MIQHGPSRTPGGLSLYDIRLEGVVTGPEMADLLRQSATNAPHGGSPILCVIARGTDFSREARQQLSAVRSGPLPPRPVAVVVRGPFLRAFVKTVFLVSGRSTGRVFDSLDAAQQWLDSENPAYKG